MSLAYSSPPGPSRWVIWLLKILVPAALAGGALGRSALTDGEALHRHRPPAGATGPEVRVQGRVHSLSPRRSPSGRSCAAWRSWVEVLRPRTTSKGARYMATAHLCPRTETGPFTVESPGQPSLRVESMPSYPRGERTDWPQVNVHREQRPHATSFACPALQPGEQATDVEVCLLEGDEIAGYACQSGDDRPLTWCHDSVNELTAPPSTQHEDRLRGTVTLAAWAALGWLTLGMAMVASELSSSLIDTRLPRPTEKPRS